MTINLKNRSKVFPTTESWFWVRGSINPFRGCEYNCTYCDGKAEWYKIEKFGTLIRIKIDVPQRYEKELLKMGYKPEYRPKDNTLEVFLPDIRNKNYSLM